MTLPEPERGRLLAVATGRSRARLALDPSMTPEEEGRFRRLVARRLAGEPLQYLEGTVPFGPVELRVDRRALIPRPETELLWEMAVEEVLRGSRSDPGREGGVLQRGVRRPVMVDLCTGSGNLALALEARFPGAEVYGTDISPEALSLARENAARLDLEVHFREGDLFGPLPTRLRGRVDLLVANPPYVSEAELESLPPEVRDHEPRRALVAGPTGDEVIARIAKEGHQWLAPGGRLLCEIAEMRAARALELFSEGAPRGGWAEGPGVRDDLTGRPRFVVARRAGRSRR